MGGAVAVHPRCWVGALVGTVVLAVGLGWLQVLWRRERWEWNSGRTTRLYRRTGGLLGVWRFGITQRPLPAWWRWMVGGMALGAAVGSLVIIGLWLKSRPKNTRPLPGWMRPA